MSIRNEVSPRVAATKSRGFIFYLIKYKTLLLMIAPAVLYVFVFSYLTMFGIIVAFKTYNYADGILGSPWVGFKNFRFFFKSGSALALTWKTLRLNFLLISISTVFDVSVAVILSEVSLKRYVRVCQSCMLLPHFVSWVFIGALAYNLLNYNYGFVNGLIKSLGMAPVNVYTTPSAWLGLLIMFNTWKGFGYGCIYYLATITGFDQEMYESAQIDGAGIMQRIFHITLPNLIPMLCLMILMTVPSLLGGNYDMIKNLVGSNGFLYDATDTLQTYLNRALLENNEIGMTSAIGLYTSVFGLLLVLVSNWLVRRYDPDCALF